MKMFNTKDSLFNITILALLGTLFIILFVALIPPDSEPKQVGQYIPQGATIVQIIPTDLPDYMNYIIFKLHGQCFLVSVSDRIDTMATIDCPDTVQDSK